MGMGTYGFGVWLDTTPHGYLHPRQSVVAFRFQTYKYVSEKATQKLRLHAERSGACTPLPPGRGVVK
jgi:hypothetical protein